MKGTYLAFFPHITWLLKSKRYVFYFFLNIQDTFQKEIQQVLIFTIFLY